MFGVVLRELGDAASGFDVRGGSLQVDARSPHSSARPADGAALAICGTAFAFVHLLDALAERGAADRAAAPDPA